MDPRMSFQSTKWSVFVLSLVTALSGITMLVLGISALSDTTVTLGDRTAPITMLVLGTLVFIVSFLGCFGTMSESRMLLWLFLGGLTALVVVQLGLGIVALVNKGAVDALMDDAWQNAYDKRPRVLRDIQEEYGCCGFRFTTDRAIPKTAPDACLSSIEFGYQISCYRTLVGGFKRTQSVVGASAIVLSALQMIAIFLTYMLIRHLPPKGEEYTSVHGGHHTHHMGTGEEGQPLLGGERNPRRS